MESDDEDVVWIPLTDDGKDEMDWWVAEMLKKGDKYRCIFLPRSKSGNESEQKPTGYDDGRKPEFEKPKNMNQMNNEDKKNQMKRKKETPLIKKPKKAASLTKSIGRRWRSFKKNVPFFSHEVADKSEKAERASSEMCSDCFFNPAKFLGSAEFRRLLESTVQAAVDKCIKEVTDTYSANIRKLEKDLEKQQELVKKLEESVKHEPNVLKEPPIKLDEEAELKKRRRTLVMPNVPEILSKSDQDKKLADIESVGRILKDLEISTTPMSVYRVGEQKEDGTPRLLKVVMPNGHDQRLVLRKAVKHEKYDGYGPVIIRPSLSTE